LPSPINPPSGCHYHKRCPHMTERCAAEVPALREVDGRRVACHYAEQME
jgi:dipeptide transport system ATP-binding protein